MPLTDLEKNDCRRFLGYPLVNAGAAVAFGIPKPVQTAFLLEQAMNQLMEIAVPTVQEILGNLRDCETKMAQSRDYLVASELEELKLRDNLPQLYEEEFNRWAKRLADVFGVPLYPFSERWKAGEGAARASGGTVTMIRRSG